MVILGLNYAFHDSTACLVRDGELVIAIEEERLTRDKHTAAFPQRAIDRCLKEAGLTYEDIDHVAVAFDPRLDLGRKALYPLRHPRALKGFASHEWRTVVQKPRYLRRWMAQTWPNPAQRPRLHAVGHHMAHVAGSFFICPWEEAALLSLDGSGEWATGLIGQGRGTDVEVFRESYFPMSLGSVYEAATEFCGFQPNYDEGKTMGLAPLGDPERFIDAARDTVWVEPDGAVRVDLGWFDYPDWKGHRYGEKFVRVFGQPRRKGEEFQQHHLDVAAAFQQVMEERGLELAGILRRRTDHRHLVVAGGVALNSVMNGRLVREAGFDDIYVMPAAGDNGTAIGAAYWVWNRELGRPRCFVHMDPYIGNGYDDAAIRAVLAECKLPAERDEDVVGTAARLLHEGKIIGWFQGRMEIGPRALGNRSILADPTRADTKDRVNAEVKHREAYRPFAPSVPAEHKEKWFETEVEAPFMLKVCDVRPEAREQIPAVTHVDGSARLQTVSKETNPRYHELLERFGELSGIPVVLNTSFNIMGEPMVESPWDAIRCFYSTGLDALVLGDYVLTK